MAKRQYFRIQDITGGWNPLQNPVSIRDNQAATVLNVRFDRVGSIMSRDGYSIYANVPNSSSILAIGRWLNQEDPTIYTTLLADSAGNIKTVDPVTPALTTIWSGLSNTQGEFLAVRDYLVYYNGADRPIFYNGTETGLLGVDAPASAPVLSAVAGSSPAGTWDYVYTYYDSTTGSESVASTSAELSVTGAQDVNVTYTASTQARVDKIRIYRTLDSTPGTYLFLVEVANATSSYTDSIPDANLGLSTPPTTNYVPQNFDTMAYFKGYFFGSVNNVVYWSNAYLPDAWNPLNFSEVPFHGNDTIVAMVPYQESLIIFGRNNIVLLNGSGGSWSMARRDVELGITGPRAYTHYGSSLIFMSYQGLREFPSGQEFAPQLTNEFQDTGYLPHVAMATVPEERGVWVSYGGHIYTVFVPTQAASLYTLNTSQILSYGKDRRSPPLMISEDTLYIWEYGGSTDNGVDISMTWRSKVFELTNAETVKFFRRIGAFASSGSGATVSIAIADNTNAPYSVALTQVSSGAVSYWGSAVWDSSVWTSEGLTYFQAGLPMPALNGHTIQVSITASTSVQTEVSTPITFEYRESDRFL